MIWVQHAWVVSYANSVVIIFLVITSLYLNETFAA